MLKEKIASFFRSKTAMNPPTPTETNKESVIDEINQKASQLLNDRWMFHEERGFELLNLYYNLREKLRTSSEPQLLSDLNDISQQLKAVESGLENIIEDTEEFQTIIKTSLNNQRALSQDVQDPILKQLLSMENFMIRLMQLYENELSIKKKVIENISNIVSSEQSHVFLASWSSHLGYEEINKLITQLKITSVEYCWKI
ncbi:hypothetical protein ACKWTF_005103 [Chironomus riparius]